MNSGASLLSRLRRLLSVATRDPRSARIVLLVAGAGILVLSELAFGRLDTEDNDFAQYYVGARNLLHDHDPYAHRGLAWGLEHDFWFCYPPLMAYLCLPLAFLNVSSASTVWFAVNMALSGLLAWQLARLAGAKPTWTLWSLLCVIVLLFPAQSIGNHLGQVHALIAVLISGAILRARAGAHAQAGVLLAAATVIKVFPGFLIPAFWLSGRRRTALVATVLSLIAVGSTFTHHLTYIRQYVLTPSYPIAAQCFVSLPALTARLFTRTDYGLHVADSQLLHHSSNVIVFCSLFLLLVWTVRRRPPEELLYAGFMCVMLLLTPPAGYYHLNLVLVVVLFCYRAGHRRFGAPSDNERRESETPGWEQTFPIKTTLLAVVLIVMPVNYGLSMIPTEWAGRAFDFIHTRWGLLLLVPQTYGLVLLLVVCVMCIKAVGHQQVAGSSENRGTTLGDGCLADGHY